MFHTLLFLSEYTQFVAHTGAQQTSEIFVCRFIMCLLRQPS